MKTIRLKYPQWQGGMNSNYVFGAELLSAIAPISPNSRQIEVAVNGDYTTEQNRVDGVDCGDILLEQNKQVYDILEKGQPDRLIVFGGDCAVTQVPFDYLNGKYGDKIGIIWLDAHPDISGTSESSHLHEMVAANLLGQNPGSPITSVKYPYKHSNFIYAGLIEEKLRPMDMRCKDLSLPIVSPERLKVSSAGVTDWIKANGIKYLAVHWDLDVLDPADFRSIYPAEPYLNSENFPAAVGRMTLNDVTRILKDSSAIAPIVGLSITEHLPWDAFRLREALSQISIFKDESLF